MSKQMAVQLSQLEFYRLLADFLMARDKTGETIQQWVESHDEKLWLRYRVMLTVMTQCEKDPGRKGMSLLYIKRVICWRNEKGEPGEVETELDDDMVEHNTLKLAGFDPFWRRRILEKNLGN